MRIAKSAHRSWARWLWLMGLCLSVVAPRPVLAAVVGKTPPTGQRTIDIVAPVDAPPLEKRGPVPPLPQGFNTYNGGWIQFAYPPSVRERVQVLIAEADPFRAELSERLGQDVLPHVEIRIARTPGEMATLAPEEGKYPKYAAGVAYSSSGLVLLTIQPVESNSVHDLKEVFRHELAHVALYDAVGGYRVPRWLNEGFAIHISGESQLTRLNTLWTQTLAGNLLPLQELERNFPDDSITAQLAYAQSADVVRYLLRQSDRERFRALVRHLREGEAFAPAVDVAYGVELVNLEYEWREDVAKRYTFWPIFFSGSLVWFGALGLFALGWRRKRSQARHTLERWAIEEAREDQRRTEREPEKRVHIVFAAQRDGQALPEVPPARPVIDASIPKVEHDGSWHTLH